MEQRSGIFLYVNLLIKLNVLKQEPRKRNDRMHGLDDSSGGGAINNKLYEKASSCMLLPYTPTNMF